MAIPDFQSIMLPLLEFASDREIHTTRSAMNRIYEVFELTDEERSELLPSGGQALIDNRVGWAKTYLTKAGLLESPKRGLFIITELGIEVLSKEPDEVNLAYLKQFPDYKEWKKIEKETTKVSGLLDDLSEDRPPVELIESGYGILKGNLSDDLLKEVKNCSPEFFERLVVDLLLAMGYGGARKEAGRVVGGSGDGGIDGIINEDKLGLDVIYIQAKRWENAVPASVIQNFVGSLDMKGANKGVLITTSTFPKNSLEKVGKSTKKVVLIDGKQLAELMIDHNIGVSVEKTYKIKKIDSDYFSEE